jgi:hypothetical protein
MQPIRSEMSASPTASRTSTIASLLAALAVARFAVAVTALERIDGPEQDVRHFGLAYWEAMPGPMQLPVFDGMAMQVGQQLVVLGGFTRELEATRAIQIRSPLDGWRPIGSALLEPRARASLLPLPNGRALVLGGYSGTWGRDAKARDDGETLDPLVAGSARDVEPFGESLDGHAATPLADGRIAVTCGCSLRLFDPTTESWSEPLELSRERHHHASVVVGDTLVLIGGDDLGSIESIDLSEVDALPTSTYLWEMTLARPGEPDGPITGVAAVALDGRHAYAAGGFRSDDRTTVPTAWCIDVAKRLVHRTPDLPLPSGACDLVLATHPRGVIILDGEWRTRGERGNVNASLLVSRLLAEGVPTTPEIWRLPSLGASLDLAHRMLVRSADGTVEVVGGYRYRSPNEDDGTQPVGVIVDGTGQRLVVDALGTAD